MDNGNVVEHTCEQLVMFAALAPGMSSSPHTTSSGIPRLERAASRGALAPEPLCATRSQPESIQTVNLAAQNHIFPDFFLFEPSLYLRRALLLKLICARIKCRD